MRESADHCLSAERANEQKTAKMNESKLSIFFLH